MSSPRAIARANFALGGLDLEIGSLKESLAMRAFKRDQMITLVQTSIIVQSINWMANSVVTAVQQGDSFPSTDGINDLMGVLRSLLLPELADDKEDRTKKAMEVMEREISKGPFKVEGMAYNRKKG